MWRKDLNHLFPIRSQTTANDRSWLAQLIEYVRAGNRSYRYLELGSFLGGTLTPALLDELCSEVLSIDLRPKLQPDSRNATYDYGQFSTASMINELKSHGLTDLAKLRTFDGWADQCDYLGRRFELAFIDAEHTDWAVFRDFLAVYDHLQTSAICAFHDSELITTGLENILAFLRYQRRKFWFGMFRESAVSAIFLDVTENEVPRGFLDHVWDWNLFRTKSRDEVLLTAIRNRLSLTIGLNDAPVVPM